MTRGNQRDLARAKNQKKLQEQKKGNRNDGLTVEQRKQRDADQIREKQQKKGGPSGAGTTGGKS